MPIKDCPPFSPCFCEQHPKVKQCQGVALEISSCTFPLIVTAIILVFLKFKRNNNYKP